jgi:uncharacterized protein YkwD
MFRFLLPCSLLAVYCFSGLLQAAPLTPQQATMAGRLLASENAAERATVARGMRAQGAEVRATYKGLLEKAELVHKERLKGKVGTSVAVLQNYAEAHKVWEAARDACLDLLFQKTDHESKKLAELAKSYTAAEKAMKELAKFLKSPPPGLATWKASAQALNEIEAELAWCRDTPESDQEYFLTRPVSDSVKLVPGGPAFLELLGSYQTGLDQKLALEEATQFNEKEIKWPAPVLKTFMQLINARRYVLGQQVLRLDERLSKCALGHSESMQRLKFFAHESPVEGHKTPWDRAKLAEFEGNCTGENIFMGSTAAEAAFMAWWESDGHRFIMFQKEANTLGLGLAGNYWTLNTGNREWSAPAAAAAKPKS